MNDVPPDDAADGGDSGRRRRPPWLSVLLFVLGIALLGGAIAMVASRHETLSQAWKAVKGASPLLIIGVALLPLVNWLATTGAIWVLTGRYGRVRYTEMLALIGAAWLLNMLPMRPGMVGRLAYHRRFNGVRVRDSMRVLLAALFCTGAALLILLGMVTVAARLPAPWGVVALVLVPPAALGGVALALHGRARGGERGGEQGGERGGHAWRWAAGAAFRYIDMVTWAIRYALVFTLIGRPITLLSSAALTVVGQAAMFAPVQVGLREWAIGLATAAIPGVSPGGDWRASGGGHTDAAAVGLLADCVMRATELLIVIPIGLVASAWVVRRMRTPDSTVKAAADHAQQADAQQAGVAERSA